MKPLTKNTQNSLEAGSSRPTVEFNLPSEETIGCDCPDNRWDWPRIQQLLDAVLSLTTERKTTDSRSRFEELTTLIYANLPSDKQNLRTIRDRAKGYFRLDRFGNSAAKKLLKPYRKRLQALVWAARQKLATVICLPNSRQWDIRAFRLYLELQQNIGKLRHAHFLTVTFSGDPTYKQIRKHLKNLTGNLLYRKGFETIEVVSLHPKDRSPGRLHVHLIAWSKAPRSLKSEKSAIDRIFQGVSKSETGIGMVKSKSASGASEILNIAAYLAWNYHQTLKQPRGGRSPIPKNARVLSRPQFFKPGVRWGSVGKIVLNSPATSAWRQAVSHYAQATGRNHQRDLRWVWRERRHIRNFLEPVSWWDPSVSGLDGFDYHVIPMGEDHEGNETYLLSSDERGGFYLTELGLEGLAKYGVSSGALPKNPRFDLTTGKTARIYETLGMLAFNALPFPEATSLPKQDKREF